MIKACHELWLDSVGLDLKPVSWLTICWVNTSEFLPEAAQPVTTHILCTDPPGRYLHLGIDWYISVPISALRLHLALNRVHRVDAVAQVSGSHVSRVDEVRRLANHAPIDMPPTLRLWLLCYAAAEAEPELAHAQRSLRVHSCSRWPPGIKRQQKWTRDVRLGGGRTQVSHVWGVRDRIKNSQANPGPGRRPPQ